jgi:hypothetical protein
MSNNPNLKCRFCGTEKNLWYRDIKPDLSFSIITCKDCLHLLPELYGDSTSKLKKLKNRIINYSKRLKMKCQKKMKIGQMKEFKDY